MLSVCQIKCLIPLTAAIPIAGLLLLANVSIFCGDIQAMVMMINIRNNGVLF